MTRNPASIARLAAAPNAATIARIPAASSAVGAGSVSRNGIGLGATTSHPPSLGANRVVPSHGGRHLALPPAWASVMAGNAPIQPPKPTLGPKTSQAQHCPIL